MEKVYDPDDCDVFCPKCHKAMGGEGNAFVFSYCCDNPKCSAYLRYYPGLRKDLIGRVDLSRFDFKVDYKRMKERKKADREKTISLAISIIVLIICLVLLMKAIDILKNLI